MTLKKKKPYDEQPRNYKTLAHEAASSVLEKLTRKINRLPKAGIVLLITVITLSLFIFFKWINAGQINLLRSGDNIINMTILLTIAEFLNQLWEFNGEEGMGWGGM